MKNNFLQFIKVTNGIFFISILIWLLFWLKTDGIGDLRNLTIILYLLFASEIFVLICSTIFYFLTKNMLTLKEQIKYTLIILIFVIDFFCLAQGAVMDRSVLVFLFAINTFSILYIVKDRFL
ncbi:hypothetical protein [Flavobacterium ginsenosidimutans]|uniref:Uncharacterized protein n=1 Tax=Flavobacterium ginsenosidimutans TaxID=687844 RepID=A0ABZ2Q3P5_9FLAO